MSTSYTDRRQSSESCEECARLWRDYAEVNRLFLKAAADREAASAAGDPAGSVSADTIYRQAGERRLQARKAVASHKALRHPGAGMPRAAMLPGFTPAAG